MNGRDDNRRDWQDLRAGIDERIVNKGSDAGLIVRRVTRRAARRADDLVHAWLDGAADSGGERLTDPDTGEWYWMYGVSGYGGSDSYGP